jgi:hypothetical protein
LQRESPAQAPNPTPPQPPHPPSPSIPRRLAKRLRKFNHENLSVAAGGKYSIVKIIASEVFEFVVQTSNANNLAKFLDWRIMRLYSNVIFANCLVFGFCLLAPDRYIPAATLISIDVLIGECARVRARAGGAS